MESNPNEELTPEETSITGTSFTFLLVEDNPGDVVLVRELLKSSGIDFSLHHVSTLKETLLVCVERKFDVILLDLGLPDSTGLETLKKIQVFNVTSPVIVMTGLDDEDTALESLREGAQDYLIKNRLTPDFIIRGIKYGIERKKIQDLLKRNARQFSLLSSATSEINECEDISAIYNVTCRNISTLLGKAGAIAFGSDNLKKVHASGIQQIEPWRDRIKLITGIDLHKPLLHFSDQKKKLPDIFNDGKLHRITRTYNETAKPDFGKEDPVRSAGIPDINIYAIGFKRADRIYGGAYIFSPEPPGDDDISIIETISNQVSLSLQRKSIEKSLKASESRYRKLNKQLEIKVRERTRDLEVTNLRLNQELRERQLVEEALKKSGARLKELNATKDKFFNIIAHDLKNPFTCLLGSTELLNETIRRMETEKIRELAQIISDSAKTGYAILLNLLDWSRSQTGLITFNPERIDLRSLIDENISDLRAPLHNKEINMYSDLQKAMYIFADKNMINTVLRNLLSNAIKFTPRSGTITVSAKSNRNEAMISVKDTGIGIPEENIGELFRIDTKYTRPGTDMEQGTGLGLKLSKEFVEKQGGKIWVESSVNKGSEFSFSIPVKKKGLK